MESCGSPEIRGKRASALGYNRDEGAPRLLAKGRDREAERIIALAREAGIEIVEDPALAGLLDAGLEPGDWIPPWCWEAVAKILAFVFEKEKSANGRFQSPAGADQNPAEKRPVPFFS